MFQFDANTNALANVAASVSQPLSYLSLVQKAASISTLRKVR